MQKKNRVDIWHFPFNTLKAEDFKALSLQEKEKADKFFKREDRHMYKLSHLYLRKVLSHYFPSTKEEEWEFETNAYGRPELSLKHKINFYFNLSHTSSRAYIVCSNIPLCGIDVEEIKELDLSPELLNLVMNEEEQKEFFQSNEKEKLFFKYWTLKEAHVKALGKGLSHEIKSISFKALESQSKMFKIDDWNYYSALLEDAYYLSFAILDKEPLNINFLRKEDLCIQTNILKKKEQGTDID